LPVIFLGHIIPIQIEPGQVFLVRCKALGGRAEIVDLKDHQRALV